MGNENDNISFGTHSERIKRFEGKGWQGPTGRYAGTRYPKINDEQGDWLPNGTVRLREFDVNARRSTYRKPMEGDFD